MRLFLYADPRKVPKRSHPLWLPVGIARPKESKAAFCIDCCIHKIAGSRLARVLLIKRVPRGIELVREPPIEGPILQGGECELESFIRDLRELKKSITSFAYEQESWSEKFDTGRWALAKVLSPIDHVLGPMSEMKAPMGRSIVRGILEDILRQMEDLLGDPRSLEWIKGHLLVSVDARRRRVHVVVGSRVERSVAHEKYLFGDPRVWRKVALALGIAGE